MKVEFRGEIFDADGIQSILLRGVSWRLWCSWNPQLMGCGRHFGLKFILWIQLEDARKRHCSGPSGRDEVGVGASFGNPAPENAIAIAIQHGFGGIVRAPINDSLLFRDEAVVC